MLHKWLYMRQTLLKWSSVLKEARRGHLGHFPGMGLTLGQMNSDVFAAVEGCFMLFPPPASHLPAARITRSRHAEWHCHSLFQPLCTVAAPCAGQLEQPRSDTAVRDWLGHIKAVLGLPTVLPAPPLAVARPSSHPTPSLPWGSRTTLTPALLHSQARGGESRFSGTKGRWWDSWKGRETGSRTQFTSSSSQNHLLILYRKPGNIHMEISHFQGFSPSIGLFPSCALHPVDHTASCFSTAEWGRHKSEHHYYQHKS